MASADIGGWEQSDRELQLDLSVSVPHEDEEPPRSTPSKAKPAAEVARSDRKRHQRKKRPTSPTDMLRGRIEQLLRADARMCDRLTLSSRRMLARNDPCAFLGVVLRDVELLQRCMDQISKEVTCVNAAMLLQASVKHGTRDSNFSPCRKSPLTSHKVKPTTMQHTSSTLTFITRRTRLLLMRIKAYHPHATLSLPSRRRAAWSEEQQAAFGRARLAARRRTRGQIVELDLLRDETRTQAMEVFEQLAPCMARREKWLRKRLVMVRNETSRRGTSSEAKAHIATAARDYQTEAIEIATRARGLEELMMSILGARNPASSANPPSSATSPAAQACHVLQSSCVWAQRALLSVRMCTSHMHSALSICPRASYSQQTLPSSPCLSPPRLLAWSSRLSSRRCRLLARAVARACPMVQASQRSGSRSSRTQRARRSG